MGSSTDASQRAAERKAMRSSVEFIVDSDILHAKTVDISDTGIRFETNRPLKIDMRFNVDGETVIRSAQLVWARIEENGTQHYGLKFMECDMGPEF